MQYAVQIVEDGQLPAGLEQVLVERGDGTVVSLISGSLARHWQFARAYEDTQEPCTVPTVLLPAPPPLLRAV